MTRQMDKLALRFLALGDVLDDFDNEGRGSGRIRYRKGPCLNPAYASIGAYQSVFTVFMIAGRGTPFACNPLQVIRMDRPLAFCERVTWGGVMPVQFEPCGIHIFDGLAVAILDPQGFRDIRHQFPEHAFAFAQFGSSCLEGFFQCRAVSFDLPLRLADDEQIMYAGQNFGM